MAHFINRISGEERYYSVVLGFMLQRLSSYKELKEPYKSEGISSWGINHVEFGYWYPRYQIKCFFCYAVKFYNALNWEKRACQCDNELPYWHIFHMACEVMCINPKLDLPFYEVHKHYVYVCMLYTHLSLVEVNKVYKVSFFYKEYKECAILCKNTYIHRY